MSYRIRIVIAVVGVWVFMVAAIVATALLVGTDLGQEERSTLARILETRLPHVIIASMLLTSTASCLTSEEPRNGARCAGFALTMMRTSADRACGAST